MDNPESGARASEHRRGLWWLSLFVLPVPVGLALWRIAALGYGSTDLLQQFLLDLLVSTYLVILLSGPLRTRSPLPRVGGTVLVTLALYVGWLYLPSGVGVAAPITAATLVFGVSLRWLREQLTTATFRRSDWMDRLGLASKPSPADAVYTRDALTGATVRTWRRYLAGPIIAALLLSFIVIRVAGPLDKRAEAHTVLETNDPFEIGRAFLKAATNGNAALFARERAIWFVEPEARSEVMSQATLLFAQTRRALSGSNLQWIDLGSLQAAEGSSASGQGVRDANQVLTYAGRAVAYLDDPENPPQGLAWVDVNRPYLGIYAWVTPVEVTLKTTSRGVFVAGTSTGLDILLHDL